MRRYDHSKSINLKKIRIDFYDDLYDDYEVTSDLIMDPDGGGLVTVYRFRVKGEVEEAATDVMNYSDGRVAFTYNPSVMNKNFRSYSDNSFQLSMNFEGELDHA